MTLLITTDPGPVGYGVSVQGTCDLALAGDEVTASVIDPVSSRILADGTAIVQFPPVWVVMFGRYAEPYTPPDGCGLALGDTVEVQVSIVRGSTTIDTATSPTGWTHDPISRLFNVAATVDLSALADKLELVRGNVFSG
jgi:hypothetical protein